ncbi:hypothetical protein GCM10022229_18160 [Luteimonas lutimaris]|uniref:Uncharacterized protein n=1 Tax=Luteimonas lutimaris TaxID=698645 RepID=A0ABP7MJG9_9GAMM
MVDLLGRRNALERGHAQQHGRHHHDQADRQQQQRQPPLLHRFGCLDYAHWAGPGGKKSERPMRPRIPQHTIMAAAPYDGNRGARGPAGATLKAPPRERCVRPAKRVALIEWKL